jgi:hypothetical protein
MRWREREALDGWPRREKKWEQPSGGSNSGKGGRLLMMDPWKGALLKQASVGGVASPTSPPLCGVGAVFGSTPTLDGPITHTKCVVLWQEPQGVNLGTKKRNVFLIYF